MAWTFNTKGALFLQIEDRMRREIVNGKYAPDQQIPSVRQLAYEASVNPNTMQKALSLLEEEGLLYTKGTLGRFVTSNPEVIQRAKEKILWEAVRGWICEAKDLGLALEDMIDFIKREGKKNE